MTEVTGGAEPFMRRQVAALRRRARWWVLGALGGLLGAFITTLSMQPVLVTDHYFKAIETRTLVGSSTDPAFDGAFTIDQLPAVMREAQVGVDIVTRAGVSGYSPGAQIGVYPNPAVGTVDFVAVAPVAGDAVKMATAAATVLSDQATTRSRAAYDARRSLLEGQFVAVGREADDLLARISAGDPDADLLGKQLEYVNGRYTQIEADLNALSGYRPIELETFHRARAVEINASSYAQRVSGNANQSISRVPQATTPEGRPASGTEVTLPGAPIAETVLPVDVYPDKTRPVVLGGVAGLVVGAFAALLADVWDDRIRGRERIASVTSRPLLAEIPRLSRRERHEATRPGTAGARRVIEALYPVRSALLHHLGLEIGRPGDSGAAVVLITSPVAREGRTTVTAGLAGAFADTGLRILAVDGDLRHPNLVQRLGGIPNLVDPDRPMHTRITGVDALAVPRRDRRLAVAIDEVRLAIEAHRADYDLILLDAAPMLVTNDVVDFLVSSSDVTVAVWRDGETRVDAARRMLDITDRLGVPTLGIVCNAVDRVEVDRWSDGVRPDGSAADADDSEVPDRSPHGDVLVGGGD